MKKVKFSIQFDYLEQLGSMEIVISKAEFDKQLKHLKEQVKASEEFGYECPVELTEYNNENEKIVVTTYLFKSGCADIYLKKYACKEGWSFAPKN